MTRGDRKGLTVPKEERVLIRTRHVKVSRRGAFLVLFGLIFAAIGYSYLNIPATYKPLLHQQFRFALSLAPLEFYGWAWIACGVIAAVGGLVHRFDWVGFGAAMLMPLYWCLVDTIAQLDHVPRAWVGALVYLALAAAIGLVAGMSDPLDRL